MHDNLAVVFLTTFVLIVGVCSGAHGMFYSAMGKYHSAGNTPEYQMPASSAVECASICHRDERGATFSYDETSQTCHWSEGLVTTGVMFSPYIASGLCPLDFGFDIYLRRKIVLCLKKLPQKMLQVDATVACRNEDAHLVLIENENMFLFAHDLVVTNAWGAVWVDGVAEDDNRAVYKTFQGDSLPFVPVGSTMTDSNQRCIRYEPSLKIFKDAFCNRKRFKFVLCQIDL